MWQEDTISKSSHGNPVSHFIFRKKLLSVGNISIISIENAALQRIKLNGIFCAYMIVELAGGVTDGGYGMARRAAIGIQDFGTMISKGYFYVDKTNFMKEWWENGDSVTLITRPRRFGKTLNMSMTEQFFSLDYAGRSDLFEGMNIWKEEKYRSLQGTLPVISLSFANVKETTFENTKIRICQILSDLYIKREFLKDKEVLTERDIRYFDRVSENMAETDAVISLQKLCDFMERYYGKKVIILLDEYDTPMQEAYVNGFWEEMVSFMRNLFNSTFKTNPYLDRAIMAGITRVSKESIFSDLYNLGNVSVCCIYLTRCALTKVILILYGKYLVFSRPVNMWYCFCVNLGQAMKEYVELAAQIVEEQKEYFTGPLGNDVFQCSPMP